MKNTLARHKLKIAPDNENEAEYSLTRHKNRPAVNLDEIDTPPPPTPKTKAPAPRAGFIAKLWKSLTKEGQETDSKEDDQAGSAQRTGRPPRNRSRGRRPTGRKEGQRQGRQEQPDQGRNRNSASRRTQSGGTDSASDGASKGGQRRSRGGRGRSSGQGGRARSSQGQPSRPVEDRSDSNRNKSAGATEKTGTGG